MILTFILLMWRIWRAPNNAGKWQVVFYLTFKGLSYQFFNLCFDSTHFRILQVLDLIRDI